MQQHVENVSQGENYILLCRYKINSTKELLHVSILNIFAFIPFYPDLSEALEKERRVNEELRNALDNDYDDTDKTDDRQVNIVKELKMSLTAVQVS